ncbi:TraR/DksA family transcriptional regulator [Pseudonocardia adelaidensis]|uniref:TraR/DksA family transcriptional regulator n=1 Tax=Pseudonocardia adelaidensis TaxID=648754 RepID=A0ABP9NVE4_9PSEU
MVQSSLARSRRQLPALREELERQRDFREEQLAHLLAHDEIRTSPSGHEPHAADDDGSRALREIRGLVAVGARQALADIELALARMDDGTYGRCRACDSAIAPAVLTAIPATTLCPACQVGTEP